MFFRPNFQFFSIFLLRCLPVFKKRRFGAILRAKQTRFSYRWDVTNLTSGKIKDNRGPFSVFLANYAVGCYNEKKNFSTKEAFLSK